MRDSVRRFGSDSMAPHAWTRRGRDEVYRAAAPTVVGTLLPSTVGLHLPTLPSGPDPAGVLARLTMLVPAAPSGHRAYLLAAVALGAWARGNGALAGEAADEALRDNPDCVLATLVAGCVARGLRAAAMTRAVASGRHRRQAS